jgi:hypothetical protein
VRCNSGRERGARGLYIFLGSRKDKTGRGRLLSGWVAGTWRVSLLDDSELHLLTCDGVGA